MLLSDIFLQLINNGGIAKAIQYDMRALSGECMSNTQTDA
jgi:hypothetical protein